MLNMTTIDEGLETAAEPEKVLQLGVDLLQGYYLARPGETPLPISEEALSVIKNYRRGL